MFKVLKDNHVKIFFSIMAAILLKVGWDWNLKETRIFLLIIIAIGLFSIGVKIRSNGLMLVAFSFIRGALWWSLLYFNGSEALLAIIDNDMFLIILYVTIAYLLYLDFRYNAPIKKIAELFDTIENQKTSIKTLTNVLTRNASASAGASVSAKTEETEVKKGEIEDE